MTPEERSAYFKRYREENKEKIKKKKQEYALKNKLDRALYNKTYYVNNKDRLSNYRKEWRKTNKPAKQKKKSSGIPVGRQANKENNIAFTKFVKEYLGCKDCGNNNHIVLQFHHLDSKTKRYSISGITHIGASIRIMKSEMKKCIVLCSNCHIIRHHQERINKKERPSDLPDLS